MSMLSASLVGTRRFISGIGQSGLLFAPVRRTLVEPGARVRGELRPLLLCHYGYQLWSRGLIAGCCGNLSARMRDGVGIYITPRTVNKSRMLARDIQRVPLDATADQLANVSVEFPMHRACYRARADIGAVIHTHAPALTALGLRDLSLGEVLPEAAQAVGGVARVGYYPSGSEVLAESVARAVGAGNGLVLLAQHGAVSVGRDVAEAYDRMELGELSAQAAVLA
jgi:L-fuculose-phosphate aldolase